MHEWRKPQQPTHVGFVVLAAIILAGLALLSVALGVAPTIDTAVSGLP
jgi:hypothetical protein